MTHRIHRLDAAARADWKEFLKLLAAIAVPVALQNLLATTASMVDVMMLASLGSNTVGAVGLCAQFSSLLFSSYWGFVGGGMLFMSQFWGAKDYKGVSASYGLTLCCMMVMGVLFCCLATVFPGTVMSLYTDKAELWPIGVDYLRIVGYAYPLQIVGMAMSAMLRSTERVRIPLAASVVSLATNMLVNWLLIFDKIPGLTGLGVKGAAWGTVIAGAVNIGMLMLLGRDTPFLLRFRDHFRWTAAFVKQYLTKCFPIICNEVLIGVGNMVINIVLGRQSTEAIAALAVFRTFEGFVISFFSGFTNAASVLVGKEVGAGNHELAFKRCKRLVLLTPIVVLGGCLLFLAFHRPLLTLMGLTGESFIIGRNLLFAFTVIATIRLTNWIQNDSFRSAGDPVIGTILEISFMYAMVLPAICTSGLILTGVPFLIVFLCAYIDEPIRLCIMLRHTLSGKWIKPVTEEGLRTIGAFRAAHGIVPKPPKGAKGAKGVPPLET